MSPVLAVWIEGARVGLLSTAQGGWGFRYDPGWLARQDNYAISPYLPPRSEPFADDADDRRVQWFFDNLLPEGGVRQAIARYARIDEHDAFGLLARFGEESAGALTLLPEQAPFPAEGTYAPLPRERLRALLAQLPGLPLLTAGGHARMSLAGAQHKLGLHRRDELFLLPSHAASSLIIKPDNARGDMFPYCPANEHFCMSLARSVGLAAPRTQLIHMPEPVYIVERFDRRIDGVRVQRRHQIDLCQLLNKWAGYKYESEGGIGLVETYRAMEQTRQSAVSRYQLLRWLIFNYLIGNSDAHAKNVAFLVTADGLELAPAYDLLCVATYGADYDYMAMTIAEQARYGWVEKEHWDALARALGIAPAFLRRLRQDLAQQLPAAARTLVDDPAFSAEERAFLAGVVDVVHTHVGYLSETLGAVRTDR